LAICSRDYERIAERCTPIDNGARNIDFIVDRTVLPEVSKAMLAKNGRGANSDKADFGDRSSRGFISVCEPCRWHYIKPLMRNLNDFNVFLDFTKRNRHHANTKYSFV
jgi:hypothetical protein